MLVGDTSPWAMLALLALSAVLTLIANWSVSVLRRRPGWQALTLGTAISHLVWMLLMAAALILGVRYVERLPAAAAIGYIVLGLGIFLLSAGRSLLRQQARQKRDTEDLNVVEALSGVTYVLFSAALYVGVSLVLHRPVWPILFVPLGFGSLLPDLDSRTSLAGRLLPVLSRRMEASLGDGGSWHSLGACTIIALITAPVVLLIPIEGWALILLGFLSHVVLDTLRPSGTRLFWPLSRRRYYVWGRFGTAHCTERRVGLVLVFVTVAMLFAADLEPPQPPPVEVPSYEQSLQRYESLRGRTLVLADVDGIWQATGRRVYARFEVLSMEGESLVMLERFTGRIFRAGRQPEDHLYLNRLSIVAGSAVRVKPVEISLADQLLADALPVVYQMQVEPGLQHIYVSGELVVASDAAVTGDRLSGDHAQLQVRRIIEGEGNQFRLQYMTASELIALAGIRVESGQLVIVATYTSPASGPTATPLPTSPLVTQPTPTEGEVVP